jgi:hypothetical protein
VRYGEDKFWNDVFCDQPKIHKKQMFFFCFRNKSPRLWQVHIFPAETLTSWLYTVPNTYVLFYVSRISRVLIIPSLSNLTRSQENFANICVSQKMCRTMCMTAFVLSALWT